MPTFEDTITDADDDLSPESQFESFYDADSATWSLRRIPTAPPPCAAEEAA
ncbi:MAG: hypothetical protein JWO86_5840 [Myxococcaceae bacterium]|nr:hypothetical protein [Myxococcaceae bacterium]